MAKINQNEYRTLEVRGKTPDGNTHIAVLDLGLLPMFMSTGLRSNIERELSLWPSNIEWDMDNITLGLLKEEQWPK